MPTRMQLKVAAIVILAVIIVVVVLQNTGVVETRLLFVTVTMPKAVLLFVTLALGFVLGMLATTRYTGKRKEEKS